MVIHPPEKSDGREEETERNHVANASLKLSRFDAVTSLFTALILFLGTFVLLMFALWILRSSIPLVRVTAVENELPSATPMGFVQEFEPPAAEEVDELMEPSLADAIAAVTDVVSTIAASPTSVATDQSVSSNGPRSVGTISRTSGPGDHEALGRWQRWEIAFNTHGKNDYATQLDYFGIELAAFGGRDNVIETATQLSTHPTRHVNRDPKSETRLYFSWKQSNLLLQFDRQLLASAGIPTEGRNIIRFTPPKLAEALSVMEKEHCEHNGKSFPNDIAKTVFESQPTDSGFTFTIVSQRYRLSR